MGASGIVGIEGDVTVQDKPAKGKVNATLDGKGVKFTITATDMASFFINQLDSKQFLRKMPTISN